MFDVYIFVVVYVFFGLYFECFVGGVVFVVG